MDDKFLVYHRAKMAEKRAKVIGTNKVRTVTNRPDDWPPSDYDKYLEEKFAKLFVPKINPVPGEGL